MSDQAIRVLSLKCSGCGSNLDITPEMESFACGYCGTQQVVQRSGGTVSLRLIGDAIAKVQMGMDRTAAELAIRRLREDLAEVEAEKGRFEMIAADGNSYTGYMVILCIVLLLVTGGFFMNGAWIAGCVGLASMILAGVAIARNLDTTHRLATRSRRALDARTAEIQRQIASYHEIVSAGK